MRRDFTVASQNKAQILLRLQQKMETQAEMEQRVRWKWAATFRLPPNDPRLLSLTLREAIEQINAFEALLEPPGTTALPVQVRKDGLIEKYVSPDDPRPYANAQGPVLTGDPEWDAYERAAWDPANDAQQAT